MKERGEKKQKMWHMFDWMFIYNRPAIFMWAYFNADKKLTGPDWNGSWRSHFAETSFQIRIGKIYPFTKVKGLKWQTLIFSFCFFLSIFWMIWTTCDSLKWFIGFAWWPRGFSKQCQQRWIVATPTVCSPPFGFFISPPILELKIDSTYVIIITLCYYYYY